MAKQLNATRLDTRDSLSVFLLAPDHVILIKAPLYTFVFVLGIFGNLSILTATLKYKSLRKPTNLPIALICIYDTILLILGIPIYLMHPAHHLRHVLNALHVITTTSIVLTMITIAVQRYTLIVHPMKMNIKFTYKKLVLFVFFLNILSVLSGVPSLVTRLPPSDGCTRVRGCNGTFVNIVLLILQYLAPLVLMTYLYTCSWYCIRQENGNSMRITGTHFAATYISGCEPKVKKKEAADEVFEDGDGSTPTFTHVNSTPNLGGHDESETPFSPFIASPKQSRAFRRCSLQMDTLKPRSCSVVSTQSVDRYPPALSTPKNIIRSLSTSLNQTQRSVTSLLLGVEIEIPTEFTEKRSNQTLVTFKMFVSIIAVFGVCMLPHHLLSWTSQNGFMDILEIFVYINATANPYVYGCINGEYVTGLAKLFWGHTRRKTSTLQRKEMTESSSCFGHCMNHMWKIFWRCGGSSDKSIARGPSTHSKDGTQPYLRENSVSTNMTRCSVSASSNNHPSCRLHLSPLPIIIITPSDSCCDY